MAESPQEKEALAKLDDATRGVAWAEEDKELARERRFVLGGWLTSWLHPIRFWNKGEPPLGSPGLDEKVDADDDKS